MSDSFNTISRWFSCLVQVGADRIPDFVKRKFSGERSSLKSVLVIVLKYALYYLGFIFVVFISGLFGSLIFFYFYNEGFKADIFSHIGTSIAAAVFGTIFNFYFSPVTFSLLVCFKKFNAHFLTHITMMFLWCCFMGAFFSLLIRDEEVVFLFMISGFFLAVLSFFYSNKSSKILGILK